LVKPFRIVVVPSGRQNVEHDSLQVRSQLSVGADLEQRGIPIDACSNY
jgi:hypothetical protein